VETPDLRKLPALQGVRQRNYDYDRFWVVFPLVRSDGTALFADSTKEAELVLHIGSKEGKLAWRIPDSIRHLIRVPRKAD
jgi:hypothetical protein